MVVGNRILMKNSLIRKKACLVVELEEPQKQKSHMDREN